MQGFATMRLAIAAALMRNSAFAAALPQVGLPKRSPHDKPVHDRRTSKYMPHQGTREMARRKKKMVELHGRSPVVRFYGSLSGGEAV